MNEHLRVRVQLNHYRQLAAVEQRAVDQHLAQCPDCAALWATYQQQEQLLHDLVEQRQRAHFQARHRRAMLTFPQLLEQHMQSPSWLATWYSRYWPSLQSQPSLMMGSLVLVLLLTLTIATTLNWVGPLPVVAQPTPVPTPDIPTPLDAAQQGIEEAIAREVAVWGTQLEIDFAQFIDPSADAYWRGIKQDSLRLQPTWTAEQQPQLALLHFELLRDDMALVRIQQTSLGTDTTSFTHGRVYRRIDDRWYWSPPVPELWGHMQTLETEHFQFEYHVRDAEIIEQIAPTLDDAYVKLYQTLGVDPTIFNGPLHPQGSEKIIYRIVASDSYAGAEERSYEMMSPLLAWLPDAEPLASAYTRILFQPIVGQAVQTRLLNEGIKQSEQVSPLYIVLYSWLSDDSLNASWRKTQWQDLDIMTALLTKQGAIHLDDIGLPADNQAIPRDSIVAAHFLIEYLVETYGPILIPLLVGSQADSLQTWATVVPDLFGLSVAQFEARWNEWLVAEYPALQERMAVRNAIEASLALEFEARAENSTQKMNEYIDPDANLVWRNEYQSTSGIGNKTTILRWLDYQIIELVVDGDLARVHVHITTNSTLLPEVVEGRFYRYVDERWLLAAPDPNAWGPVQTLETTHFSIQYHELEADIVQAAAGELEVAYTKLLNTLALPEERPQWRDSAYHDGKFHFAIVPQQISAWTATETVHKITSPFFSTMPNDADAASFLAYSAFTLVGLGLIDEVNQQPTSYWWNTIGSGINQWVLEDSLSKPHWLQSQYRDELLHEFIETAYPVTMENILTLPVTRQGQAAGILLMEYITTIYSRDEIPRFMHSLNQHEGWNDLIPAIFGVSIVEFEEGWNGWLAAEYPEVQETVEVRVEIEKSLAIEAEARSYRDASLISEFIDPDANAGWLSVYRETNILYPRETKPSAGQAGNTNSLFLEDLQVTNDIAWVRVRISYRTDENEEEITTVEGRFYRQVGDRWLLTSPIEELLGVSQVLETKHFRITYFDLDADAVKAAAPEIEAAYSRLLMTLNLPEERPAGRYGSYRDGKFDFQIVLYEVSGWNLKNIQVAITSPFFERMSPTVEASAQLSYNLFQALLNPLIDERLASNTNSTWGNVVQGIRLWIAEDSLIKWTGLKMTLGSIVVDEALADYYPLHLAKIKMPDNGSSSLGIGFTLMEFTVDTYGREKVVALLQGLNETSTWDKLIPAVFAVTTAEFERNWNEWLERRYTVDQTTPQ